RFSIKGEKYLFYDYDGYSCGHATLDEIIAILKSNEIRGHTYGSDSALNVSSYETSYDFEDGGLFIYSGNAFFDSKHGAYIFGFRALRWIIDKLHLPQPRRFKGEWIVIAQGGDGYNTLWHDDFEPVMEQIYSYVNAIDVDQLDLDWREICERVPYLKDRPWDISKDRTWEDFIEALEGSFHCVYLDEEWDGGMPGQSGHFFTLELRTS